jgi:hypothetical protein
VRHEAERVYLAGEWRLGPVLLREQREGLEAEGGQPYQTSTRSAAKQVAATLAEKVGNRTYVWRMKVIAPVAIEALNSLVKECQQDNGEASLTSVVKLLRKEESLKNFPDYALPSVTKRLIADREFRVVS